MLLNIVTRRRPKAYDLEALVSKNLPGFLGPNWFSEVEAADLRRIIHDKARGMMVSRLSSCPLSQASLFLKRVPCTVDPP